MSGADHERFTLHQFSPYSLPLLSILLADWTVLTEDYSLCSEIRSRVSLIRISEERYSCESARPCFEVSLQNN